MQRSYTRRLARLLMVITGSALTLPAAAQAHHTAVPVVALDYRNRITSLAGHGGVRASLEDAGRKLRLTVRSGLDVVVLGLGGEPFLRFSRAGVAVNRGSLTALSERLTTRSGTIAGVSWLPISRGHSFAWIDTRIAGPPASAQAKSNWAVPIVVNGRRSDVDGALTRVPRPSVWPWILLAAIPVMTGVATLRWRGLAWPASIALGTLAAGATLATLAGFAGSGLTVSGDRWLLFALEVGVVASSTVLIARRSFRLGALAVLSAFTVLQALSDIAVFRHGVVVSALPAWAVRGTVAISLGCGVALGLLAYRGLEPTGSRSVSNPRASRTRRTQT